MKKIKVCHGATVRGKTFFETSNLTLSGTRTVAHFLI